MRSIAAVAERKSSLSITGFFGCIAITLSSMSVADTGPVDTSTPSIANFLNQKWVLSAGATWLNADARVGASANGLPPIEVELPDLGLEKDDSSYFSDLTYRFDNRWAVQASIYSFSSSGRGVAERDFSFGGQDFTVGAELDLGLDIDAYLLHASYELHSGNRFDLRVGGGIHALDLDASIRAALSVGDTEISGSQSSSTLLAPVPNLRAEARWYLSDRLALLATAGWLSADVDDYDGEFFYTHLQAVYSVTKHIGVGVGYHRTSVDITESRERSQIVYDVQLDGATVTLKYSF